MPLWDDKRITRLVHENYGTSWYAPHVSAHLRDMRDEYEKELSDLRVMAFSWQQAAMVLNEMYDALKEKVNA